MAELMNRQWLLAARPQGLIKESDFRWNEATVSPLQDGQVLVRNLAFSFDPTQRGWMSMDTYIKAISIGNVMLAGTVGQVVESKRPGIAKGDLVQGLLGWEDYSISDGKGPDGIAEASGRNRPAVSAVVARHHRTYRILRHALGRKREGGRDLRGIGRGGRHRFRRGHDREGQRMPRDRHRGRPRRNANG